ncbi:hypothetical protein BDZ94DRAFT_1256279 [Collybia nuda]|uniref:Uncharacterized protein n=1 Tax=Collybia nuda TaxID=64659 RepID=A0A9P6CJI3_9AGAR|nr:hypothetical protein BDZ94DRAFT_1256279 [Collybia nuda]
MQGRYVIKVRATIWKWKIISHRHRGCGSPGGFPEKERICVRGSGVFLCLWMLSFPCDAPRVHRLFSNLHNMGERERCIPNFGRESRVPVSAVQEREYKCAVQKGHLARV